MQRPSIRFLPPQLADQIAAGEVIERPASVLKELIENALDAHATRIDIDLAAGGMDRIRVTDNGNGIVADELPLAVSRHATSKLDTLQQLMNLQTLGFRGEALASICSVSQWQLISATGEDHQGAKLSSAHPSQTLIDSHPRGTTVQIDKLFHNTPARRKFLRAERTEFRHCDDIVRRMALARFDVGFFVRHNARQVHRLPAVHDDIGRTRRVRQLCGEQFVRESLAIDYHYEGMRVWGWISRPSYTRQQTDLQYFYINGRVIRDRMINHAVRVAYHDALPTGRQPAYVLHLEIEADRFDVNVHPTKQEVRFRETRMVHDFLSHSLRRALQADSSEFENLLAGAADMDAHAQYVSVRTGVQDQAGEYPRPLAAAQATADLLHGRYHFHTRENQVILIDVQLAWAQLTARQWHQQICTGNVTQQPLLIPERIRLMPLQITKFEQHQALLARLGFDVTLISAQDLILRLVPAVLAAYQSFPTIIAAVLAADNDEVSPDRLCAWLVEHALQPGKLNLPLLLQNIFRSPADYQNAWREITPAEFSQLFASSSQRK